MQQGQSEKPPTLNLVTALSLEIPISTFFKPTQFALVQRINKSGPKSLLPA